MSPRHDWSRDMEPLPIRAAGVASFLRSCGRPRAAAWVAELGEALEKARAQLFELQMENSKLAARLHTHEPVQGLEPRMPTDNRSHCE